MRGELLYHTVLVPAVPPHEWAAGIHLPLPLDPPSHLPSDCTPQGCGNAMQSLTQSSLTLCSLTR